ncbi:MAG: pilus assembly protein PilM [bacterium]|nr:pilus assembly protein PilM [bacterium]
MSQSAGPIAVDLGRYALRVAQVSERRSQARLVAAVCHTYSTQALDEGREVETVEALRRIIRSKRFTGRRVVSALSEHDVQTKNFRMPQMPDAELAQAVRFEALERMAGVSEDAEIRHLPAGSVVGGGEAQQEVIVLAAREEAVRGRLELLSKAGLNPVGIDVLPCTVFRPFERYLRAEEDAEQVNAFVDLGWSGTRITVTRGNRIAFTKAFECGGASLDRLVAENLGIEPKRANELRRGSDAAGEDADAAATTEAAVRGGIEQIGKEIGLCLRYYAVTFRGKRPETVTCVGGEALCARQIEMLSEVVGLPCRAGFPLRSVECAGAFAAESPSKSMAEWTTAAGLAMKMVNRTVEAVA